MLGMIRSNFLGLSLNKSVKLVNNEITKWQNEITNLSNQLDSTKHELQLIINDGVTLLHSCIVPIAQTENIINEELKSINTKIDNIKIQTENKIKEVIQPNKINDKIDSLKTNPLNGLKKWMKK